MFRTAEKDRRWRKLQEILDQNPTRMLKEMACLLDVSQNAVSNRLKAMKKIEKGGNWILY